MAKTKLGESPTTRVQIEFSEREVEKLEWIMHVCEIKTRKDLFNNALTLLDWAVNEVGKGRKLASCDDASQERTILTMPILNAAAHNAKRYVEV